MYRLLVGQAALQIIRRSYHQLRLLELHRSASALAQRQELQQVEGLDIQDCAELVDSCQLPMNCYMLLTSVCCAKLRLKDNNLVYNCVAWCCLRGFHGSVECPENCIFNFLRPGKVFSAKQGLWKYMNEFWKFLSMSLRRVLSYTAVICRCQSFVMLHACYSCSCLIRFSLGKKFVRYANLNHTRAVMKLYVTLVVVKNHECCLKGPQIWFSE